MRIAVDAMGGDNAPQAPVLGALQAVKDFGAQVTLVGKGEEILKVLKEQGISDLPEGMEIAHADEVVDMHDDPANVVRRKKDSSMVVGLRMLADGNGDAFISAGSTGALLSAATLVADLLLVLIGLAQRFLESQLAKGEGPGKGTILEIKEERGLGKTLDMILYSGTLKKGDTVALGTRGAPVVTKVKAILKPKPLDEIRDPRDRFDSIKELHAAAGGKIYKFTI